MTLCHESLMSLCRAFASRRQLGDELLDELLTACAQSLFAAADNEVEKLAAAEVGPLD